MRPHLILPTLAAFLCATPAAHAWGPYGHAIIADIAQDHLTPAATQQTTALLALEGHQTLDQVASWPDAAAHIPKSQGGIPETLPWHYVDIDTSHPTYDATRDCPNDNCVTEKLPQMIATLSNPNAPPQARLLALKWVVHQVGDLHQPLHAAEHAHDKGGNTVRISYFGDTQEGHLNLHSLWDEGILDRQASLVVGPHYSIDFTKARVEANTLNAQITPGQAAAWTTGYTPTQPHQAVVNWTNESHTLARTIAYGALPPRHDIAQSYTDIAWPVIQTRLEQAGIRLAAILNAALPSQ